MYRVREFSKDNLTKLSEFGLNLSDAADGRGRVSSLLFKDSSIFIALATTVSGRAVKEDNDDGAPSDIILVRMKQDWTFDAQKDVRILSSAPDDVENYVSGFDSDTTNFYIIYKQSVGTPPSGENRSWIKVFDKDFNLMYQEKVMNTIWGPGGGEIRPSLEVLGNRIFSGQSSGQGIGKGNAEMFVYEITRTTPVEEDRKEVDLPTAIHLYQNYPNPFSDRTTIRFAIRDYGRRLTEARLQTTEIRNPKAVIALKVFDLLGREVLDLSDEANRNSEIVILKSQLPHPGVYFYRLSTPTETLTKAMVKMR